MDRGQVPDANGVARDQAENDGEQHVCEKVSNKTHRRRYFVNFLVVMFGLGGCITTNGIIAEVPLLVKSAPEGSTLSSHLIVAVMTAYFAPALYALSNRSNTPRKIKYEFIWISSALVIATVAMGLFGFFHDVTIRINSVDHSIVMIILTFILASVAGSDNVLLMPYLRNIEEVDITSFFVGERLSGFIPSIIALIQGVGGEPICPKNMTNFTDPPVLKISEPKFSSRSYFLIVSGLLAASTCSFWLLEYSKSQARRRRKNVEFNSDHIAAEERVFSEKLMLYNGRKILEIEMTDIGNPAPTNPAPTPGKEIVKGKRIHVYALLWLTCLIQHGYLNTIEIYSSRPYGNSAHNLVVNLSQLAGTLICVIAYWLPPIGVRAITGIIAIILVATSHVSWLALRSPTPPLQDTTYGIYLLITIWIVLTSLITFAKLAITTIIWRDPREGGIYKLGLTILFATMCSSSITFYLVNFTAVFTPYIPCEQHG